MSLMVDCGPSGSLPEALPCHKGDLVQEESMLSLK